MSNDHQEVGREGAGRVIRYIAAVAHAVGQQAGVGAMETAGSIVSYLAEHPERIEAFMANGSVMDWPARWHVEGCLTWHGADGKIHGPDDVRLPDSGIAPTHPKDAA